MTDWRSFRFVSSLATWFLAVSVGLPAVAGDSADRLLDRVPSDATVALVIEDLGEHWRAMTVSPLVRSLADVGLIRAWLDSEEGATLRRARRDIERVLAAPFDQIADGLLGQAVVLSLHLPSDAPPESARGLFQTVVSDRDLLQRFIDAANAAETGSGALRRVESRRYGGVAYSVRDFEDGRPDEAYALLDDSSFVWTNSEHLLRNLIDRIARPHLPSMTDDLAINRVRRALPDRSIAKLLVDPRFVSRLARAEAGASPFEELPSPLSAYLGAIEALGTSLEWRDGPVLHVVEALDPGRLPAPIRSWASRPGDESSLLSRIPPSALLAAAGHIDAPAVHDLILASVPDEDRDRVESMTEVLRGLLLGRDLRSEILPAIGPGVVGWISPPPPDRSIREAPAVVVASIGEPAVAEALENALRTVLAFLSLDENRKRPLRLKSEGREGYRITALMVEGDPASTQLAFAVGRGMIVIGTEIEAVAAVLSDRSDSQSVQRPAALEARDCLFPEASTFVFLDLDSLHQLLSHRREDVERLFESQGSEPKERSTREDLSLLLELMPLFRALYMTSNLSTDATIAHRRIGLIVAE